MTTFAYTVRDVAGRRQTGVLEAASPDAAVGELRTRGLLIVEVAETKARQAAPRAAPNMTRKKMRGLDLELGLQQLAVLQKSGVSLLAALRVVAEQAARTKAARVWNDLGQRIQAGSSLADAMAAHRSFPPLAVQLARIGEQTGELDYVLLRAAETLEQRRELRMSLINALTYPAIVLVAALGVAAFMVLSVIPKIEVFLHGIGRRLPAITQLLLDLSAGFRNHVLEFALVALTLVIAVLLVRRWAPGRLAMDRWLLRVPVIGHLLRTAATVAFARAMALLLHSGVNLVEALRTAGALHGNRFLANIVAAARDRVVQGSQLAPTLAVPHGFMPMLSRMTAVGEQAGSLDDMLNEVARFHTTQLQSAIRRFSALIEPAVIVVVGTIVGFVYIAFFMALFSAGGVGR